MATVTKIPATLNKRKQSVVEIHKKKVAGYARVSTDHEEQASSFEAQIDYYTKYINSHEDWEYAGIYTDDGISATNTKHRIGFNQMVEDALAGKIDLIITKSVSRFARNTVDSLTTVRKLKEKGIEIYFEKENIWTLDAKGELLITIMSSLAQEESRSISENTTWGQRKRFSDGNTSVAFGNFLGYDKGENGEFVVNTEQAKTIKLIYRLYLSGLSFNEIARELTRRGIKSPMRKNQWYQGTVKSILTNEKYKGDALLQKYYTSDFLTKKQLKNTGEIPQYYVEGHHEAIISPEIFEMVQAEILRRKEMNGSYSGVGIFSSKIQCGECGNWYGAKVWHSKDPYRKTVYQCNRKFEKGKKCSTPHFSEGKIKEMFIEILNKAFLQKDEILQNIYTMKETLCDVNSMENEQSQVCDEMNILNVMIQNLVNENAQKAQNQAVYQERYDGMVQKHELLNKQYDRLSEQITNRRALEDKLQKFITEFSQLEGGYKEFDEEAWCNLIEHITVYSKDDIRFVFIGGIEVKY